MELMEGIYTVHVIRAASNSWRGRKHRNTMVCALDCDITAMIRNRRSQLVVSFAVYMKLVRTDPAFTLFCFLYEVLLPFNCISGKFILIKMISEDIRVIQKSAS